MPPLVTVLMAVYNGQRFLSEALESIFHQTWTDFEFLIINDGSSDRSRDIILSYDDPRIRLVDNPQNIGLTPSLNRGLELARGSLIARLDADDISCPARLEKQVRFLHDHPEVALLGTKYNIIDEHSRPVRDLLCHRAATPEGIKWQFMVYNPFVHSSVMFRREIIWTRLGGYRDNDPHRDDFELWSRVAVSHGVANLPEVLVKYRAHEASLMGKDPQEGIQLYAKLSLANMRRYLDDPQIPEEWGRLIAWMLTGMPSEPVEDPSGLLRVITSLWRRFVEIHPEAQEDQELHRLLAGDLTRAALMLAPQARWTSFKAFSRALREDREVALANVAKYLALLLLGESRARSLYLHFRRFSTLN